VTARFTFATAKRNLVQLRHDRRTLVLVICVPLLLLTLIRYVFDGRPIVFQRIGPPLLGIFPLVVMFLITSIAMLRERTSGTLERLMTLPPSKLDLLGGYGLAFGFVGAVQAAVASTFAVVVLGLEVHGRLPGVLALAVLNAELGMALGLLVSAFARTEFQAVQFMPAFVLPQLLLCGLFVARAEMNGVLRGVSDVLPMTYAYDALARVAGGRTGGRFALDLTIVLATIALALVLGAATLRRRTA
jgi:ABC-2 type transport system permease protein